MPKGRDSKRVASQFLNGLAVAIFSVGLLGPITQGDADLASIGLAITVALALHGLAQFISWR